MTDYFLISIEFDPGVPLAELTASPNFLALLISNGILSVTINDLENPSNTLILTDSFTGTTTTDIDNGMSDFGTISMQ